MNVSKRYKYPNYNNRGTVYKKLFALHNIFYSSNTIFDFSNIITVMVDKNFSKRKKYIIAYEKLVFPIMFIFFKGILILLGQHKCRFAIRILY